MIQIQHNLDELNRAIGMYRRASGKSVEDTIKKQGTKLGFNLKTEFGGLAPGKGNVRTERLAALKRGEGVHVRPSVYRKIAEKYNALGIAGKMLFRTRRKIAGGQELLGELQGSIRRKGGSRLNLQALAVERELSLRESGRGFMRQSARFIGKLDIEVKARSRYNRYLANMGFKAVAEGPEVKLAWGGMSQLSDEAVKAIMRTRGRAAVARALSATTADIVEYLDRKLGADARMAGMSVS